MAEIRKLSVIGQGKTYYLTLPKNIIEELSWRKGQKLEVRLRGDTISIQDWQPQKKTKRKKAARGRR